MTKQLSLLVFAVFQATLLISAISPAIGGHLAETQAPGVPESSPTPPPVEIHVLDEGVPGNVFPAPPVVAVDETGYIVTAWEYQLTNPGELYTARFTDASGWEPKELLDMTPVVDRPFHPRLAVHVSGMALLVWSGQDGLYSSTYLPGDLPGAGWQPPQVIAFDDKSPFLVFANSLHLVSDSAGTALLVWTQNNSEIYSSQHPLGGAWSAPEIVGERGFSGAFTPLVMTPTGEALLLWQHWMGSTWTVYGTYFDPGAGGWQQPPEILHTSQFGNQLTAAMDGSGEAMAVWSDLDPGGSFYFATFTPEGGWEPKEILSTEYTRAPEMAMAPHGDAIVIWRNAASQILGNRYLVGLGWQGTELLRNFPAGGTPGGFQVQMDREGNALAAWGTPSFPPTVEVRRFLVESGWDETSVLAVGNEQGASIAHMAMNSFGSAVVTWREDHNGPSDFLAARYASPLILFADGFESGDTTAWSMVVPSARAER